MKFSKFLASLVAIAAVASMATVSVSAADYGGESTSGGVPMYPGPASSSVGGSTSTGSSSSSSSSSTDDKPGTSDAAPVKVVTDASIKEALKGDAVVYIDDSAATLKKDAIGEIAAQDKPVTFDASDYTVTIDPATIEKVGAIDISMDIEADADGITITPAASGEFGMTLSVTIPASTLKGVDTAKAHLYYVSDSGKVTDLGKVKVNKDGSVTVDLTHASYYVIADEPVTATIDDDDAALEDDDDDDDISVVVTTKPDDDANPYTGVSLALGAAVVSAAAVALTSKKRK